MLSALIGVLIIVVIGAICFWAIDKFANDRRLAQLLKTARGTDLYRGYPAKSFAAARRLYLTGWYPHPRRAVGSPPFRAPGD